MIFSIKTLIAWCYCTKCVFLLLCWESLWRASLFCVPWFHTNTQGYYINAIKVLHSIISLCDCYNGECHYSECHDIIQSHKITTVKSFNSATEGWDDQPHKKVISYRQDVVARGFIETVREFSVFVWVDEHIF